MAPSRARRVAIATPSPRDPPVTRATLPVSFFACALCAISSSLSLFETLSKHVCASPSPLWWAVVLFEERHDRRDDLVGGFLHQPVTGVLHHGAGHIGRDELRLVDKERPGGLLAREHQKGH